MWVGGGVRCGDAQLVFCQSALDPTNLRTRQRINRHAKGVSDGIMDCLLEVVVVSGSLA